MAVDWTSGYRASWRVLRIDPDTWAPSGALTGVDSAGVSRSRDGVLEEGSLVVTLPEGREPEAGWYRIEMLATQGASSERVQVATMWFEPDGTTLERGAGQWTLTGQSAISPAAGPEATLPDGAYARKGADGAAVAAGLLARRTPAPVVSEGRFALRDAVVYDLGSTELEAAMVVLARGGHCVQIDGDGTARVVPLPSVPSRRVNLSAIGATMALVEGDDGVARRAWTYEREWWPDVHPQSLLELVRARGEPERLARVESQSITLGRGITVQETAVETEAA